MTSVFFYHLERQPLEQILPRMLVTSLERGWRVVVQAGSVERAEALASHLWSFDDESFLPHGTSADGHPELQPVWLTATDENPNLSNVRFYVDGAPIANIAGLTRAVIIFDGNDNPALEQARTEWKRLKSEGHEVTYWQQDAAGRWQNRAASR
jgi:DNA polymerase-3 subunit chi